MWPVLGAYLLKAYLVGPKKEAYVVMERETRPGTDSTSSQKENQEMMTIREHGR